MHYFFAVRTFVRVQAVRAPEDDHEEEDSHETTSLSSFLCSRMATLPRIRGVNARDSRDYCQALANNVAKL